MIAIYIINCNELTDNQMSTSPTSLSTAHSTSLLQLMKTGDLWKNWIYSSQRKFVDFCHLSVSEYWGIAEFITTFLLISVSEPECMHLSPTQNHRSHDSHHLAPAPVLVSFYLVTRVKTGVNYQTWVVITLKTFLNCTLVVAVVLEFYSNYFNFEVPTTYMTYFRVAQVTW